MKPTFFCVLLISITFCVQAKEAVKKSSEKASAKATDKKSTDAKPAKVDPRFAKLKQLVGTWQTPEKVIDGKARCEKISYKLTAGGTALIESFAMGTPMEMTSVYYMDGDNLRMTHYCVMGNQPRMKADKKIDGDTLRFTFDTVTNAKEKEGTYMRRLNVTFKSKDKLKHSWFLHKDGKEHEKGFEFTRVKEDSSSKKEAAKAK